jgi:hypothetical protein
MPRISVQPARAMRHAVEIVRLNMIRSVFILALASALAAACSRESPPQSGAAEKVPAPASAPTPAATPAPSSAQPTAATPQTATPGQAQPESAPPQAPASGAAQSPTPGAAPEPSAPAAPTFRVVTIPAETPISVTLVTPIASNTSKVEDQVRGKLTKAIIVGGTTVVPAGSEVIGAIIEANESGRVKGRASVSVRFDRLTVRGESHRIKTARIAREAASSTKSDVKKGAVGAGAGAIVGGIAGGGTGAAIGAGVGGAATVLATKGKEVELAAGTTLSTRLLDAVKVQVPMAQK